MRDGVSFVEARKRAQDHGPCGYCSADRHEPCVLLPTKDLLTYLPAHLCRLKAAGVAARPHPSPAYGVA